MHAGLPRRARTCSETNPASTSKPGRPGRLRVRLPAISGTPSPCNEVQEWQEGARQDLEAELQGNTSSRLRGRPRLQTPHDGQCFARGVVRGSVECANLIDNAGHGDPTAAETVKTAQIAEMSLRFGVQLLQAATQGIPLPVEREQLRSDLTKNSNRRRKESHRPAADLDRLRQARQRPQGGAPLGL